MGKGVRSQTEEKASSFLVEVTGMTLVLFSLLAFLCVITGESLFWNAGKSVKDFLYGIFGAYVFLFLIHLAMFGVRLVIGRSVIPKDKRLTAFVVRFAVVCVFAIVHLCVSYVGGLSFGEELGNAFGKPQGGEITAGGAICSLICFPLTAVAAKFGAIVFFAVALLLSLAYLFRGSIISLFSKKTKKEGKPKKQSKADKAEPSKEQVQAQSEQIPQEEPVKMGYFFNEQAPFAFKTKKELAEGRANRIPIMSGVLEPKNIIDNSSVVTSEQLKTSVRSAQQPRVIPDRGRKVNLDHIGQSPMNITQVSEPIPTQRMRSEYEDTSISKDVYTIPVKPVGETAGRTSREPLRSEILQHDGVAPSNVGGLFDNMRRQPKNLIEDERGAAEATGNNIMSRPAYNDNAGAGAYRNQGMRVNEDGASRTNPNFSDSSVYGKNNPSDGKIDTRNSFSDRENLRRDGGYIENAAEVTTVPLSGRKGRTGVPDSYQRTRGESVSPYGGSVNAESAVSDAKTLEEDAFQTSMPANYKYTPPPLDLLEDYLPDDSMKLKELQRQEFCKKKIVDVYKQKKIDVSIVNVISGPSVTRYDFSFPDNVMLDEIFAVQKDLSFKMQAGEEFLMKVIPKTNLVGIEISSDARRTIGMKEVMQKRDTSKIEFKKGLYFMLGENILGNPIYLNLIGLPHLLIAGATGMGKSVCLNVLLVSLLYRYSPEDLRIIIVDPKLNEFNVFVGIPHLLFNEIFMGVNDNKAIAVLNWAIDEMERRYRLFAKAKVKNISGFNASVNSKTEKKLPYILILIDEFSDIMSIPETGKKFEAAVQRLAQKARAAGISLICATQRPSANVFSPMIKSNIPSRICFHTSSTVDSRIVLEDNGAYKLLAHGDCLYKTSDDSRLNRAQGAFISEKEIKNVVEFIKSHNKCYFNEALLNELNNAGKELNDKDSKDKDDLSAPKVSEERMSSDPLSADEDTKLALRLCISRHSISTSSLRSLLRMGYNKAASIIFWLERMHYISPPLENKMRKPLITAEQYEQIFNEKFTEVWNE